MSQFIETQKPVIERTGMGLLPGVALALFISLGLIAAIAIQEWWVLAAVVFGVLAVSATVTVVIADLIGSEAETYGEER